MRASGLQCKELKRVQLQIVSSSNKINCCTWFDVLHVAIQNLFFEVEWILELINIYLYWNSKFKILNNFLTTLANSQLHIVRLPNSNNN
jgi:hypothetical protein